MKKIINSKILVAYSQCPRKAYLLLCTREKGSPHEYVIILEQQKQAAQSKFLNILRQKNLNIRSYNLSNLEGRNEFIINANLEVEQLAAECAVLKKVKTHSKLGRYSYEPIIFVSAHTIKKEHKLELFYVSHVLGKVQGKIPVTGYIIGLDGRSHKIKIENIQKTLFPLLEPLKEWSIDNDPEPPYLILNKHCTTCLFYSMCKSKAEQEDNLSLIDSISTYKTVNKYEKKGLFTVKQLSYTFKPRKRNKRLKNPPPITHKPELQSLSIREGKIYIQEMPKLLRESVEFFLDIEGVPDRQFYYLMGLLLCKNNIIDYHSFWADFPGNESQIWQQFIDKASQYPNAPIYHYGSFDSRVLDKLSKRYGTDADSLNHRLVNINKYVFGKVYFPTYSNKLKDIGAFIGATWTSPNASGLQSLIWRHLWDETHCDEYKNSLLIYNKEDCLALKSLTDELSKIEHSANTLSEVDFVNQPKRHATEFGEKIHTQFEMILKFSHSDYDKGKISFKQVGNNGKQNCEGKKKPGAQKGRQSYQRLIPKTNKTIRVPRRRKCFKHKNELLHSTENIAERTIIDLVFSKSGVRKQITKYFGTKSYCKKCHRYINPRHINNLGNQLFGHNFQAWAIYQRLFLRLPYRIISQVLEDQFNERVSEGTIIQFQKYFADYYFDTENILTQHILSNSFIHVDETKINIQGVDQYVWVLTDGKHVILKLTKTRESIFIHEILANYHGILISDFYPGYDSVECNQQKCWGHLIRDLNNDLWANPFDSEFGMLFLGVRNLIIPIMDAVKRYGLKKRNLSKFKKSVDIFYKKAIINKHYKSELSTRYQSRFLKYQDSLFTFLEHDEIPWHNNMAERALRHLAVQRKISGTFFESTAQQYLLLLGIMQTCKFQNKSFLKFLLSNEKDIDLFKQSKRRKNTKAVGPLKKIIT